ncbi:MAG TPA: flagellar hook-basal body protein [Polyangiaceae bacterium]|jgi:flagellar basal-body rod protein FlgF|nr:flagellar hook-basal body protein [Polyangiaceae bacterium]
MSTGIWAAASGAVGQTAALDTAAQNIANAATPGYKSDEVVFRQSLVKAVGGAVGSKAGNLATNSTRYAISRTTVPDFRAGGIVQTARPLDVAIPDDKSFFAVSTTQGERYTRAGSFRLTVDGSLTTPDGHPVIGTNRRPIKVDPQARNVSIDRGGSMVVDGVQGAQIARVSFANLNGLERTGEVLFKAKPEAGPPLRSDVQLETSSIEQSNANAVTGMTSMVNTSRNFEMISKVIEAFGQIDKRAANDIMGK